MTDFPSVLIDARRGARGLGVATFVERLMDGFRLAGEPPPALWQAAGEWGAAAVAGSLARSGLFDVSPRLDPRTRRYEVVHYACNLGSIVPGPNSVLTVHDLMHRRSRRPRTRLMGALLEQSIVRAGRVVAVSGRTREEVERTIPALAGRVEVIPHGMRRRAPSTDPRRHILAFGGAADPRKRTDLMVAAYRAYFEAVPDPLPLVVLARAGLTPEQRQALRALGARIVPTATTAEVDHLMATAGALLYTTKEEGFGLPLLEAAEAGTPVVMDAKALVAGEVVGRHVIRVGGTGFGGWVAGLKEAVKTGAVHGALDLPGWDEVARRYAALYREVGEKAEPGL